jgi:CBS domain-containing protein
MLDDGGVGILTDRDLRSRVLAVGRNGGVRVDSAMTAPAYVVAPDRLGADVLYEMLERGIRHAPVISERGQLVGVLEDADLFAAQPRSWFGARRAIARARNLDELADSAGRLPALMLELHASSVPALELARVLSALADALTVRALELVGADPAHGPVYVALGSQARRELTPGSTWRGALVGDAVDGQLHAAITDALARCGVQGPIVIRSADDWLAEGLGSELAMSVLADRRVLWGTPEEPLPTPGDARGRVVATLSEEAFAHVPPTGFDADSVLSLAGRQPLLNIRSAAIVPIAAIGTWAAAAADIVGGSTPERLAAAAAEGVLSADQAATLSEAFELALELRIVHHLERLAAGEPVDDLLDPAAMTPLTRSYLRDVFRAVSAVAGELRP